MENVGNHLMFFRFCVSQKLRFRTWSFLRKAAELLTKAEDILVQAAGEARESQKKHNVNNCFLVPLIGGR